MKELNILKKLEMSRNYLSKQVSCTQKTAIISGSGLGNIKNNIKNQIVIPYKSIPYFKQTSVEGHKGELVFGQIGKTGVVFLNGRLHYYEGYSMSDIVYPVYLMKILGIETIIITCAAGAVNKEYSVGDIVVIKDHINFMFNNPLIGGNYKQFGEKFPDLSNIYDKNLIKKALASAHNNKINAKQGVYLSVTGPAYETPAEISAFRKLGADIVGMSLAPESIVAKQTGMKILALAYVSNYAAGTSKRKLCHKDVLSCGASAALNIEKIISNILKGL